MSKDEPRINNGARLLHAHIKALGMSIPAFCERHNLDRIQVQRVLNGERGRRISVDFAHAIDRATAGKVPWTAFLSRAGRSAKAA